ncbi:hypothetical protein B0H13DRAFT_2310814 [Mycena leptocephala]|nr:hypothetical protein B0H13DRAFT_2310814 [Mycena leptocephala]
MPLQDRAQFIISQAMHQLSSLFTAPWPAQPFTPPRRLSSAASTSGSSLYSSYPTTPHRPHTHPDVFDSGASLPPPLHLAPRHPPFHHRPPMLFKVEEDQRDDEVDSRGLSATRGRAHNKTVTHENDSSSSVKRKDKGKEKLEVAHSNSSSTRPKRKQ